MSLGDQLDTIRSEVSKLKDKRTAAKTQEEMALKRRDELLEQAKELNCSSVEELDALIETESAKLQQAIDKAMELINEASN